MAYVGYCSSDAYVGDAPASESTFGFAFRGAHAIPAVLQSLMKEHGFGSTGGPEDLLLAGCSAGGRGTLFNIDYVTSMVPKTVNVRGFMDSSIWLDVPPYNASALTTLTLQQQTALALRLVNGTGRLSPACSAAYPGTDAWRCLYGQYRLPFVMVPYLVSQAQFDECVPPLVSLPACSRPLGAAQ